MWLEDLPAGTELLVCLSSDDEIVNCSKVVQEMKRLKLDGDNNLLVWKGRHAVCVTSPRKWKEIKERMLRHELRVLQQGFPR